MLTTAPGGRSSRVWLAVGGVAVVAAATWYVLPALSGDHGDVGVWGGPTLESSIDTLSYELRDRGRGVTWAAAGSTWCELAGLDAPDGGVDVIVLAPEATGSCAGDPVGSTIDRWSEGVELVVVPLGDAAMPQHDDVTVVDPTVLLGDAGTTTMPCEWWDSCAGVVEVRGVDGQLTTAGQARVARMIAAAVG